MSCLQVRVVRLSRNRPKFRRVFLAAATFALVAVSVGAQPSVGGRAPVLKVKELGGSTFWLASELRKGPVFVSFWATWCPPCREEFPLVSKLARQWQPKGVRFISVAIKDNGVAVKQFVRQQKPAQRVGVDLGDGAYNAWDLRAVPASFLVGKGGRIVGFYDQFDKRDIPAISADFQKALKAYSR